MLIHIYNNPLEVVGLKYIDYMADIDYMNVDYMNVVDNVDDFICIDCYIAYFETEDLCLSESLVINFEMVIV